MNFRGARCLITGGLGFVGSNVARRLVHLGAEVSIIDSLHANYGGNWANIVDIREKTRVEVADVRDAVKMSELLSDCQYLFNLAAQTSHVDSMREPHEDLDINTTAQLSMLETCRKINPDIRIVYASTRQLYGKPAYLPVDEAHPIRPVDVNGVAKLAGEQFHLLYHDVYGLRSSVLRLTNTYGPGMRIKDARQMFLGVWIKRLLADEPIQVFGDGLQLRDFTYVDDCVEALLLAASNDKACGSVYNIGGLETLSLSDLARRLIDVNGRGEVELVPFPAERKAIDIGDFYSDFSKLSNELSWQPTMSLEVGLDKTLSFYRNRLQEYL